MFSGAGRQSKLSKKLVIEAALASHASSRLKICLTHWFTDDENILVSRFILLIGVAKAAAVLVLSQCS